MWTWLSENYGVVSAVASVATLCVWVAYLQLFYSSYRHQLSPKIMITRGGGHSVTSRCMLTNMSPEIVFIQAIVLKLDFGEREFVCSLSDIERVASQGRDQRSELFQGPLSSGEYLDLGSFEELVQAAIDSCAPGESLDHLRELGVTAVGTYTWHDQLVAAERLFKVRTQNGQRLLESDQPMARQIRSRREKRRINNILQEQTRGLLMPVCDPTDIGRPRV